MNKKFDRNNAFALNIVDDTSGLSGSIQDLIPLQGDLFSFADNSISKVLPAESIDPENLHPETRHSYQKIYSIGCNNSYVARTIIQTKQILNSIILNRDIDKQIILDHAWSCSELLFKCEEAHFRIYNEVMKLMHECDAIIEKGKNKSIIPTLPQVDDLEGKVAIFLGNAKRFLEKTHEFLCLFYNAPNSGSNFQTYREWMAKNKPDKANIIKMLEEDKDWINQIASLRNAHEINHSKPQFDVEIMNFKLNPGNKGSTPGWKYDFRARQGSIQTEFSDILTDMNVYLSNLLTFFEELLICCIQDSSDKNYNFEIYKQIPENINKKCPTIYFVSLKKDF
jgi:hypothetical protein